MRRGGIARQIEYAHLSSKNPPDFVFSIGAKMEPSCKNQINLTLQTYFAGLDRSKLSHESRDKIRDVLSAALGFAKEHGIITVNPAESIRVPRDRRGQMRPNKYILTPEQFGQLIELIPEPYATMVYIAIFTGLRVSKLT